MRSVALPQLALAVRQRADLDGQQNAFGGNGSSYITDSEITTIINASIAELWDILTEKYGDNYAWGDGGAGTGAGFIYQTVPGTYRYQLPYDFYKEHGVDMALDSTGVNWATVRPFTLRSRNRFAFPLQTALGYAGWQNCEWQIQGQMLSFQPQQGPLPGQFRLLYCPCAPTLVASLPPIFPYSTAVTQNQLFYVPVAQGGVLTSQVFVALNSGTTGSSAVSPSVPGTFTSGSGSTAVLFAYQGPLQLFQTTFDGISGYEDLLVLDSAIKCLVKQEADVSALMAQKQAWLGRINNAAANRAAGDPMTISGNFGMNEGGPGYGNGFGFGGAF